MPISPMYYAEVRRGIEKNQFTDTVKREAIRRVNKALRKSPSASGSVKTAGEQLIYQAYSDENGKVHVEEL